jgi:hypothetical protein
MRLPTGAAVWEDRPAPPAVLPSSTIWFNAQYEKQHDVPAYDRSDDLLPAAFTNKQPLLLPSNRSSDGARAGEEEGVSASWGAGSAGQPAKRAKHDRRSLRCFNCGSYAHNLRDCWRPWDADAVEKAKRYVGFCGCGCEQWGGVGWGGMGV